MHTYSIGEVAERSGFSASALRFYEGIGLVTPASRTDAGYRVYDDGTLSRLAFIARAKQLGCSLEEIGDLASIWDGDSCGPVQRRFHDLVTAKLADAQRQVTELTAWTTQLHRAAAQLTGAPADGPCDEGCACVTESELPPPPATPVSGDDSPPIACTLPPRVVPERLAEWQAVLARARTRTIREDGALRVDLPRDVALDELARLVAAEQACCAFFAFTITVDARGVGLEVRAPGGATDLVRSVFGEAA